MSNPTKVLFAMAFVLFLSLFTVVAAQQASAPMPLIDLKQVVTAVERAQGATPAAWVQDLEWRINQIYQGRHIIRLQVQARRIPGNISGYIEPRSKDGNITPKLIFTMMIWKQRRALWSDVKDHTNWVALSRTYPMNSKARFVGVFTARKLRYLTPTKRFATLRARRAKYRQTPGYKQRVEAHKAFMKEASAKKKRSQSPRGTPRRHGGKW